MFLENFGNHVQDCTVSQTGRPQSRFHHCKNLTLGPISIYHLCKSGDSFDTLKLKLV
jgi:hypothetical protein